MTLPIRTPFEWVQECKYIAMVAEKCGLVREMNSDTETFVRYCEMQRDMATRAGRDDAAEYIQHVIDDMKESM